MSLRALFFAPLQLHPSTVQLLFIFLSKICITGFSLAYRVSKIGVTALSMAQGRQFEHDQREGILVNAVSTCIFIYIKKINIK